MIFSKKLEVNSWAEWRMSILKTKKFESELLALYRP
jgi:hypothetical protein